MDLLMLILITNKFYKINHYWAINKLQVLLIITPLFNVMNIIFLELDL